MLEIFRKLRGNKAPTAADLREGLAAIDLAALKAAVSQAHEAWRAGLLTATDAELNRLESTLSAAKTELERGKAMAEELTARIAEAEVREARAALDRDLVNLRSEAERVAVQLRTVYAEAGREIVDALAAADGVQDRIRSLNAKLIAAGREADALGNVEDLAFGKMNYDRSEVSAIAFTSMIPVDDMPGWGSARERFEALGVRAADD